MSAKRIRCAIYTRKSTEDGLEQEFNSLDAQREACAAYILSQRHEGWVPLPDAYDDGGFSGGSMERPGLKQLLADVEAGKVDVIVVYKVDRLTRSLADFAKIVDVLDAKGASFVSVTQAFNTTTSMGRLTLNVLLSFAQFEREVTGERIRDKIAASKKKGLWMGGPVPLGYDVQDRKLVVNEQEAQLVNHILQRYRALPSVRTLIAELDRDGHRTKVQQRVSGPHRGGIPFRRGTLYHLLKNRIYLGEIVHKGQHYPGEHPAIVPQALWDQVQAKLNDRGPGTGLQRGERRSWLTGLIYDRLGRRMTATHAIRGTKRYRYYATGDASADQPAWRVAAHDLERIVLDRIAALLTDRDRISRLAIPIDPRQAAAVADRAAELASTNFLTNIASIGVERIDLHEEQVRISLSSSRLLGACKLDAMAVQDEAIVLIAPVERVRRGHELRLIIAGSDDPAPPIDRDQKLVDLLSEAIAARDLILAAPDQPLSIIANAHGRCRKRMAKLVRLSWIAPELIDGILTGRQPATLTAAKLVDIDLPLAWAEQKLALGM